MNARRKFLGLIGKAAVAAPALPHVVSESVARRVADSTMSGGFVTPQSVGRETWTHKLSKTAFNALYQKRQEDADKIQLSALHRQDGCDPDIHCLRSLSPTARQRMQMRRDTSKRERLAGMARILWPEDD